MLRRRLKDEVALEGEGAKRSGQLPLGFLEAPEGTRKYEYAVLVTSLQGEIMTIGQLYRDRADAENVFDELKNQWGWAGFTTRDLHRCQVMARHTALIYNWWSLFVRLAIPDRHAEAITSRPLLLHAVWKQTSHAGQKYVRLTSAHRDRGQVQRILSRLNFFSRPCGQMRSSCHGRPAGD